MVAPSTEALRFEAVEVDRLAPAGDGAAVTVLRGIWWRVRRSERWAILGPNGSGKTTLLELASGYLQPTRGVVEVLGQRLGAVDVRTLRERVGLVSSSVANKLVGRLSAAELVLAARHGALEPWWNDYTAEERSRARALLDDAGFGDIAGRPYSVLSEGERKQVLLARVLMGDPELLLLDEPVAGLDVGGRERVVRRVAALAKDTASSPIVMVTHHVEEVPPGFTHALLLREGTVVAAGPIDEAIGGDSMSVTFGMQLEVQRVAGRWSCRAV